MSSGAYLYKPPKPSYAEICQNKIDELNKERENITRLYRETLKEIESIKETIAKAENQVSDYSNTTESSSINGMVSLISTETHSGSNLEELYFADIEVETGKITVVAIDFSEQISLENAINSTEYKKMAFASKIIKSLMGYCYSPETEKDAESLISTINTMLEDNTVGYDFFVNYVFPSYQSLQKKSSKDARISDDKWSLYCSLCALVGAKPRQISLEDIDEEIDELSAQVFQRKYICNARKALHETLEELGLQIVNDYELENISGSLIEDKENPDYQLFLSDDDDSFALEMIESNTSGKSRNYQQSLCGKRKRIYEIMARKGYPLFIATETDYVGSEEKAYEKKKEKESTLDRMKKRHVINGRVGRARVIKV